MARSASKHTCAKSLDPPFPSRSTRPRRCSRRASRRGRVLHDFRGRLENLALLIKNTVQIGGESTTFEQLSVPTPLKAFELLQLEIKT